MPLSATCSLVISAACHRSADDIDVQYMPVQWGVVPAQVLEEKDDHCCFTTYRDVEPPKEGGRYI